MPAPLAKGIIIAASVLVAAGIAIYESPQVRQWVDHSRRKIAVALHSLGDEIQPRPGSSGCAADDEDEARRKRREAIIRRNRNELIRRAREEGVAVDLDELANIGREGADGKHARDRTRSFDDFVGSDGMLKNDQPTAKKDDDSITATTTTAVESTGDVRRRGRFMRDFHMGSSSANPFADEVMFDRDLIAPDHDEAPSPNPFTFHESRESTATLPGDRPVSNVSASAPLIDISAEDPPLSIPQLQGMEAAQTTSILIPNTPEYAEFPNHAEDQNQSFYSFASSTSSLLPHNETQQHEEEAEVMSAGTLTPRSDGFSTAASMVGSHADDIAVMSMQSDDDHDARSEIFSEGGFTEAGFSEAGFSELGEEERRRMGAHTPSSWTDIGSESGSEFGGPAGQH